MVQQLVSCGIRSFVIIDHDKIDVSNLNRQFLFTPSDLGDNKIDVVKEYIVRNEPKAEVSLWANKINTIEDLSRIIEKEETIDFIACCADTPKNIIESIVSNISETYEIPCGFCGLHLHFGYWGPILYTLDDNRKFQKYLSNRNMSNDIYMPKEILSASIGFTNSITSSLYSKDIINFLLGDFNVPSISSVMRIDFISNTIKKVIDYSECEK